ncbi:MAG: hypothetical protein HGA76_08155 [Candidatus Firestonebacteria bacterium]|nr:hypothetical protein [Candidatus Firestonebacteria bacterium]
MSADHGGRFEYREGKKQLYWIWWVVAASAFVTATLPWIYKKTHKRAFWLATGIFVFFMFALENLALYYGWWIWNDQKLWGIKVGLVPLEEVLFYLPGVPAVIVFQIFFECLWSRSRKPGRS